MNNIELEEKERIDKIKKSIETSERRIKEKQEKIIDFNNELDLLLKQEFDYLKNNIIYPHFIFNTVEMAAFYFNNKNTIEGKDEFKLIKNKLEEILKIENLNITDMVWYDQNRFAIIIKFKYKDDNWILYIPFPEKINYDTFIKTNSLYNLNRSYKFKLVLFYGNGSKLKLFGSTFEEKELGRLFPLGELEIINKVDNDKDVFDKLFDKLFKKERR